MPCCHEFFESKTEVAASRILTRLFEESVLSYWTEATDLNTFWVGRGLLASSLNYFMFLKFCLISKLLCKASMGWSVLSRVIVSELILGSETFVFPSACRENSEIEMLRVTCGFSRKTY